MPKFRKKPVVIEAMQFPPVTDIDARLAFDDWAIKQGGADGRLRYVGANLCMTTTQGQQVTAEPGEWIIPDRQPGTFYPCDPDVFKTTYESAE